ncbi:hypothetical protein ED733_006754 [Metarhizium rileyi]|uniref:Uncharacterized protein n=1 Tax=Metarhizium rileyi (strain RCEF 4871) TaxID=1649241 RepID=A0A5C6GE23_METRR|nr:hypothetical protein ED733_006754 [Metarhizium rileyi]
MTPGDPESSRGTADYCGQSPQTLPTTPKRAFTVAKSRSNSPRKCYARQPLTIRVNLTERQMNKVTRAHGSKGDDPKGCGVQLTCHATDGLLKFSETAPNPADAVLSIENLAQRRNQMPPPPINTSAQLQQSYIHQSKEESVHDLKILSERQFPGEVPSRNGNGSEVCSSGQKSSGKGIEYATYREDRRQQVNEEPILDTYNSWANGQGNTRPEYPKRHQSLMKRPPRSESTLESLNSFSLPSAEPAGDVAAVTRPEASSNPKGAPEPSPQFSPLPLYFRGQNFPTTKKGEKTMIGQNGWLECTGKVYDDDKKPQAKRLGFLLNNIKKIAKDVLIISLDAREQSLLYCELEFHLTSAMNNYITAEFERGHLLPDSLKKISDFWLQQGRPRVISFRYDLETQLELVAMHLNEFSFYGRRQNNLAEIMGLLHSMKVNASAMRVRTFCQPDSVIAKQLVDSQSLFNMLNVSTTHQIALTEIGQFFRMIVERERARLNPRGEKD